MNHKGARQQLQPQEAAGRRMCMTAARPTCSPFSEVRRRFISASSVRGSTAALPSRPPAAASWNALVHSSSWVCNHTKPSYVLCSFSGAESEIRLVSCHEELRLCRSYIKGRPAHSAVRSGPCSWEQVCAKFCRERETAHSLIKYRDLSAVKLSRLPNINPLRSSKGTVQPIFLAGVPCVLKLPQQTAYRPRPFDLASMCRWARTTTSKL